MTRRQRLLDEFNPPVRREPLDHPQGVFAIRPALVRIDADALVRRHLTEGAERFLIVGSAQFEFQQLKVGGAANLFVDTLRRTDPDRVRNRSNAGRPQIEKLPNRLAGPLAGGIVQRYFDRTFRRHFAGTLACDQRQRLIQLIKR